MQTRVGENTYGMRSGLVQVDARAKAQTNEAWQQDTRLKYLVRTTLMWVFSFHAKEFGVSPEGTW